MAQVTLERFLESIDQIEAEKPTYKLGGDGTNGECDCIGLIIGAIRRAGGSWSGIHGSNYAARSEMESFSAISAAGGLSVGDAVYKAKAPGESGYSLPSRYDSSVDKNDYYHVGVVRSIDPLRIVHCTGPGVMTDTKLGKWSYHGRLKKVEYGTEKEEWGEVMELATVYAEKGSTVNMRKSPGGTLMQRVPVGSTVTIVARNGDWAQIDYAGKTGWMMASFLRPADAANSSGGGETPDAGMADAQMADVLARLDAIERRLDSLEGGVG